MQTITFMVNVTTASDDEPKNIGVRVREVIQKGLPAIAVAAGVLICDPCPEEPVVTAKPKANGSKRPVVNQRHKGGGAARRAS